VINAYVNRLHNVSHKPSTNSSTYFTMLQEDDFEHLSPEELEHTNPRLIAFRRIQMPTLNDIRALNRLIADLQKELAAAEECRRRQVVPEMKVVERLIELLEVLGPFKERYLEYIQLAQKELMSSEEEWDKGEEMVVDEMEVSKERVKERKLVTRESVSE